MHSNVISNWNGFPKGLGLSKTATFNTCTFAIFLQLVEWIQIAAVCPCIAGEKTLCLDKSEMDVYDR